MLCPICPETQLLMTNRQDIEIDYCPKCRGVWLDRGELDKIIEKSQQDVAAVASAPQARVVQPIREEYYRGDQGHGGDRHGSKHGGSNSHGGFFD